MRDLRKPSSVGWRKANTNGLGLRELPTGHGEKTMIIWKEFTFDAAHKLPNVPAGHKCGRMHGHTYRVRVEVSGAVGEWSGWVADFADIKEAVGPVLKMLDHSALNDFAGLENPTAENLAVYLWGRIKPWLPMMSAIEVRESLEAGVRYSP